MLTWRRLYVLPLLFPSHTCLQARDGAISVACGVVIIASSSCVA